MGTYYCTLSFDKDEQNVTAREIEVKGKILLRLLSLIRNFTGKEENLSVCLVCQIVFKKSISSGS